MGLPGERILKVMKITHMLVIDNLNMYQRNHKGLNLLQEEKLKALEPNENELHRFLGSEQEI